MDTLTPIGPEFKSQDLKKRLLDCLDRESRQFSEIARAYFDKEQLSLEDRTGLLQAVIETVDHVMGAGDWNSSLFLRNTLKPLLEIKAEAELEFNKLTNKATEHAFEVSKGPAEDECEVYISLFQSDGYNTGKWAMHLRALERYIIGRPVYTNEEDVKRRIKMRVQGSANEAYVAVIIKKADIQPAGIKPVLDSLGRTLIQLKETALKNGKIVAFVHEDVRYHFVDGQLIKQT